MLLQQATVQLWVEVPLEEMRGENMLIVHPLVWDRVREVIERQMEGKVVDGSKWREPLFSCWTCGHMCFRRQVEVECNGERRRAWISIYGDTHPTRDLFLYTVFDLVWELKG